LLNVAEARKQHDGAIGGDGCWQDDTCPSRRSYYRKGRGRLAQRKTAIPTVVVPISAMTYVVLHTYLDQVRQPQDDVVIHAMCAVVARGGADRTDPTSAYVWATPPDGQRLRAAITRSPLSAIRQGQTIRV